MNDIAKRLAALSPGKRALIELLQQQKQQQQSSPQKQVIPPRSDRDAAAPLSLDQERLWFIHQLNPDSPAYNINLAFRLKGTVNVPALHRSLNEIVRRHEILRTYFAIDQGKPAQVSLPSLLLDLPQLDLSGLPEAQREPEAVRLLREHVLLPFDLTDAPLLRALLIRIHKNEYGFLVTLHHIITDWWSVNLIKKELTIIYQAFVGGRPSPLPEPSIQYADFAVWQRGWLHGQEIERLTTHWKQQLSGAPHVLELPTDRPRSPTQTFKGTTYPVDLPKSLYESLKSLARQEDATMYMAALCVFQLLLYRYTGQKDFLLGSPSANRNRAGTENMLGYLLNMLVLRARLADDPPVREFLRRTRAVVLDAYSHQDMPFGELVARLHPERDLSRMPLVQLSFVFLMSGEQSAIGELSASEVSGISFSPLFFDQGTARYDITFGLWETPEGLTGHFEYNVDLFDASTMQRMAAHFRALMQSVVANPDMRVSELPMLSEAETYQLLFEWNRTRGDYAEDKTLHALFAEQVERTPEAIAVVYADARLTYAELNEQANQLAHHLRSLRVGADVLVGILLPRSVEMIVALLGILKAGGAYLPLDPAHPQERISYMLEDSCASLLLTHSSLHERVPPCTLETVYLDTEREKIAAQSVTNPDEAALPDSLVYVMYTSGSTGLPKGAMLPHRGINNCLHWMQNTYRLDATDSFLFKGSLNFDASVWETFWPLLVGARVVVAEPGGQHENAYLIETVNRHGVTSLYFVPPMLQVMLDEPQFETMRSLRRVISGGESLSPETMSRFFARSEAELHHSYGPTEASIAACEWTCERESTRRILPIGRPLANTELYILDERLHPVPVGVLGELYIGGDGLARGYLHRPALTAEKFIPNPYTQRPGARLYRTADVARFLPNGEIEFAGRADEQVKVRGIRIEPAEVQSAIEQHPSVREAVVVADEDRPGHKRLVAYVAGDIEPAQVSAALRAFLAEKLPDYMIPSAFVLLEQLPLTPNGKVDRRALPAPDQTRRKNENYTPPRTTAEQTLVEIWTEVLQVGRVGIHDNFFELGGDSILSIQIVARASQAGLHLTARDVFQRQTVAELAEAAAASTTQPFAAEQGIISGPLPLTPIQHWFFEQQLANPHHYNQAVLLETRAGMSPELIERALEQLLIQHDALRLSFTRRGESWEQSIAPPAPHNIFSRLDLTHLSEAEQTATLEAQTARLQTTFDLSHPPLMRVAFFDFGEGRAGRLFIVAHHLLVDGIAWRILLEDLQRAYEQLRRGVEIELPPKTSSLKQWAERLALYAESEKLKDEAAYWMAQNRKQATRLPVDFEQGGNTIASTRTLTLALTLEETRALLQDVPGVYHTQINDLLLTALAQAVGQWSHSRAIRISMEGHGREELFEDISLTRTVGWFTSIYPLTLDVSASDDFGSALKSIKEQLRSVPERGVGYGLLRYLNEDFARESEWLTPSEISFNYLGQVDQVLGEGSLFRAARESSGLMQDARNSRSHLLDVNAIVSDGCLRVTWAYSAERHRQATIERLAAAYTGSLRGLIAHCQSAGTGGYTPSDFPLTVVEQPLLDGLWASGYRLEDIYPLSPLQHGLWFHTLYEPRSEAYIVQISCRLQGNLNTAAFKRAWHEAFELHPTLRTSFIWEGLPDPLQLVHEHVRLTWREDDWRNSGSAQHDARLKSYMLADRLDGFDLQHAPLTRLSLIQLAADSYYFIWSYHHILLDGWSLPIIFKQVFELYDFFCRDQELNPQRSRPYRDYIEWLQHQDIAQAEGYWRTLLQGFTERTSLAATSPDRRSDEQPEGQYGETQIKLSEEQTDALRAFARTHQLTLSTLVQGAWALLLSRSSNVRDVVYGSVVSGRAADMSGIETMVGPFINTLPVRVITGESARLLDWLKALQEQQVEQRRYEYSPLVQIQGWSDVPRGETLFESIFAFENYPVDASLTERPAQERSLSVTDVRSIDRTNYPLTLAAAPGRNLILKLTSDRKRIRDADASRLLLYTERLLTQMPASPLQLVRYMSLLSAEERQQILCVWNNTLFDFHQPLLIHQLFDAQAARSPLAPALFFEQHLLSYHQLLQRSNQLAHFLISRGVSPDVTVALLMERSVEMVVALLAILKAGGSYLPLDPSYPPARLSMMLADAGVSILLTQQRWMDALPLPLPPTVIHLNAIEEVILRQPTSTPSVLVDDDNLAYVIYTSGSTGQPKGVMNTHAAIRNRLLWMQQQYRLTPADRVLQKTPYSFDVSVWEFFWPLLTGAALVVARPGGHQDSAYLIELIEQAQVSVLHFVPPMLAVMMEEKEAEQCRSVRQVISSGEALGASLVERFEQRWPGAELDNLYGPTEAAVDVTWWRCEKGVRGRTVVPIGRPIANTEIYILDWSGQPALAGVSGELYIGGVQVARGYLGRPEMTAQRFVPHPFSTTPGARLYRTGDLARYLPAGEIEYVGRVDTQVKVRGYRIELGEIEAALLGHERVRAASVMVVGDEGREPRLVAYVVMEQETHETDAVAEQRGETAESAEVESAVVDVEMSRQLRTYLSNILPTFMIPSFFIFLPRLPLTPNGKLDRRALPSPDASHLFSHPTQLPTHSSPLEELLAGIFADILGLDHCSAHDNFFDLGGHSLLATRLISRLKHSFHLELPLRSIFEHPTLEDFARFLQPALLLDHHRTSPPLLPVSREADLPLSFAQQRLWFLDQLQPSSALYNIPLALRLTGALDLRALHTGIERVVARHEALRTNFQVTEGVPVQVIAPPAAIEMPVIDLSGVEAAAQREAEVRKLMREEARRPFDLAQERLVRSQVVKLSASEHVWLLTLHHIVSDAWSIGILLREVAALYAEETGRGGEAAGLEELRVQYGDYAVWQREWLKGEVLAEQLGYWREQLAGAPAVLEIPADRARPAEASHRGGQVEFRVGRELTKGLRELSRREGVTLFMTLLAAFQMLLSRYSNQRDVTVGTVVAGRTRAETEGLIGFFVNTLALRTKLGGNPGVGELLRRVREVCLGAYAHQELPFEKLVEELAPERSLSHTPLFQVMLILQNVERAEIEMGEVEGRLEGVESEGAKYEVMVEMEEVGGELRGRVEYRAEMYERERMEVLVRHYERGLRWVVEEGERGGGERGIEEWEMLSAEERQQVLCVWNNTLFDFHQPLLIHQLFDAQAARSPLAPALFFEQHLLSYHQLLQRSNQLAHLLISRGVSPDVTVALLMERSVEMVVALLAILKAGGSYLPLDPSYPPARLSMMLADAGVSLLLTQQRWMDALPQGQPQTVIALDSIEAELLRQPSSTPSVLVDDDNLAYVIYTSGSTGQPKGVMNTHAAIRNRLLWMQQQYRLTTADRVLQKTPYSFDVSVWEFFWPLLTGAALVVARPGGHQDSAYLIELIEQAQVSVLHFVPPMLAVMMEEKEAEQCRSVRQVISSGEALGASLVERFEQRWPGAELDNLYGPTEAAVDVTWWRCEKGVRGRTVVPIGRPIANTEIYILDWSGQPALAGVSGELYIGGVQVARGYLGRPEMTAQRFVPHPFSTTPGARLYRTGDLARYLPAGEIEYVGRVDTQVKVRGYRIELGEIEAALLGHERVRAASVMVVGDEGREPRLVAYVVMEEQTQAADPVAEQGAVAEAGERDTEETAVMLDVELSTQLRAYLSALLPEFMLPSLIVRLARMPLLPNGKVNRAALPQDSGLWQGAGRQGRRQASSTTEEAVEQVWCSVLGVGEVGMEESFFELGGHSLLAAQVISRLREAFGVKLTIRDAFTKPTVALMSEFIEELILAEIEAEEN